MMASRVLLGTNVFVNSEAPIAFDDQPLVAFDIEDGRLLATLHVPRPPASVAVYLEANNVREGGVDLRDEGREVSVSLGGKALLTADLAEDGTVSVSVFDLRPIGLAIFSSPAELRIGGSVLSGNSFVGARYGVQLGFGSR